MIQAGAAIVVVWGVLLGVAYVSRSALAVISCYLVFSSSTLLILGIDSRGALAAAGMLAPAAVATALARLR